ncbi:MAG: response regulator [Emticicia sp.]|uniref:response regulator n=1 Tax=Emticicia sp. TaxID=1930953 RepID=UPI003BA3F436
MIRILLVDDHKIFTEGVASLLLHEPDIEILGECQNSEQVKALLQITLVDVVLLDINLGGESGLDLCKYITSNYPHVKVLAMTMHSDESFITRMMKNGANGYLLKNTGGQELLRAIRTIKDGQNYQSAEITEIIMRGLSRQKHVEKSLYQLKFTRREKEVLDQIAKGKTTRQIANELCISEKTVETHRSNLLSKFDVKNVVSLLKIAIEYGHVK